MRIARAIVAAGWVAVAFSSADREMSRCWEFEVDGPRVLRALSKFRHRHGLDELPAAALGASSGGDRVLRRCRRSASSGGSLAKPLRRVPTHGPHPRGRRLCADACARAPSAGRGVADHGPPARDAAGLQRHALPAHSLPPHASRRAHRRPRQQVRWQALPAGPARRGNRRGAATRSRPPRAFPTPRPPLPLPQALRLSP